MRIALNGTGRIAKNIVRIWAHQQNPRWHIGMIHMASGDPDMLPYALTYDTTMGVDTESNWSYDMATQQLQSPHGAIPIVTGSEIVSSLWGDHHIDTVVDASGAYTQRTRAQEHIDRGGAARVLVTAPMDNSDATVILGYNTDTLRQGSIICMASCTTNATIPLLAILEPYGLEQVHIATLHAYTQSQSLLDGDPTKDDPRRHRAAPDNIVPSGTGAARALAQVMPQLKDKIRARSYRVPVCDVSIVEVVAHVMSPPTERDLQDRMHAYISENRYCGYVTDPVVSSDLRGSYYSVSLDASLWYIQGNTVTLAGWYDNEWAYAYRVCEALDLLCT